MEIPIEGISGLILYFSNYWPQDRENEIKNVPGKFTDAADLWG